MQQMLEIFEKIQAIESEVKKKLGEYVKKCKCGGLRIRGIQESKVEDTSKRLDNNLAEANKFSKSYMLNVSAKAEKIWLVHGRTTNTQGPPSITALELGTRHGPFLNCTPKELR